MNIKKILKTSFNVLLTIFLVFSVIVTILALASQSNSARVPSIGGKIIFTVLSPSMEPKIKKGDIIIGNKITLADAEKLEVDTIITFTAGDINGDGIDDDINTHRIIEVKTDENGKRYYVTKGDNNPLADNLNVKPEDIIAVWNGTRIAGAGKALNYLQQPTGFFIVIVLPLVAFFIYELILFIKKFIEVKSAGKKIISASEEEEIKRKAIEEYLRSQNANAPADNDEDTKSEK